jgi:hypothetical protein
LLFNGPIEKESVMSETAQLVELDASYPIGKYQRPESVSVHQRMEAIAALAALPGMLSDAVKGLDREQLDTPYREGGWTVRQLVHHIADSHMNAFLRVRLALTEDWPTITPYDEKAWAKLRDSAMAPAAWSVALVEDLHARWVMLLESLTEEQWAARHASHPERGPMHGGGDDAAVCVALAAPRGAHYAAAGARGLVGGMDHEGAKVSSRRGARCGRRGGSRTGPFAGPV